MIARSRASYINAPRTACPVKFGEPSCLARSEGSWWLRLSVPNWLSSRVVDRLRPLEQVLHLRSHDLVLLGQPGVIHGLVRAAFRADLRPA